MIPWSVTYAPITTLQRMKSACPAKATERASRQQLRRMFTPIFIDVCLLTSPTIVAIAAIVIGGALSLKNGASPAFSTTAPSRPAVSSFVASDTANWVSSSIDLSFRGAPGRAGKWIMPMIGLSSNGPTEIGTSIPSTRERKLGGQRRALTGGARDGDRPTQCLDAVGKP